MGELRLRDGANPGQPRKQSVRAKNHLLPFVPSVSEPHIMADNLAPRSSTLSTLQ